MVEPLSSASAHSADVLHIPAKWSASAETREPFLEQLRVAERPLLICDYDGTLAPFQVNKMQAYAYPGVAERLARIASGRTRLAFVSGRPAHELMTLLPLAAEAEIWGMHGREHREADGSYTLMEPHPQQRSALDQAQAELEQHGLGPWLERKAASVALHWRSLDAQRDAARLEQVRGLAERAFAPHAGQHALALLPFDGGLELRAEDQTKGHAVEALLAHSDAHSAAFLGDDTTDEDAFAVLRAKGGLGLLVREPPRASQAHCSLRPPGELLDFLDSWLAVLSETRPAPGVLKP